MAQQRLMNVNLAGALRPRLLAPAINRWGAPAITLPDRRAIIRSNARHSRMSETPTCNHKRTRLIAKDNDSEYVECLDCGAILDVEELPDPSRPEPAGFDESLSDA
jgi:hypothetical protein